jgi:hypothetical protein
MGSCGTKKWCSARDLVQPHGLEHLHVSLRFSIVGVRAFQVGGILPY